MYIHRNGEEYHDDDDDDDDVMMIISWSAVGLWSDLLTLLCSLSKA